MKKKEFLTEAKRKAIIADKEKAILESFAKTFNKIKRVDENEIKENWEEEEKKKQLQQTISQTNGSPVSDEEMNNVMSAMQMQKENEMSEAVTAKEYYKYVIERLSPYFGEFSEYFADILYYYNENKELINPKNDKNIDKIGKSFYGFSRFRSIGSIDKDEAMSYDIHIFTDDENTIIDTVNYLVNYLKDFRVDSIKQIDFMVDNDLTGDLEQEKFIYDNLIPSEELKKYFIKKSYDRNFTTDNNNSFNPYFMDKIKNN